MMNKYRIAPHKNGGFAIYKPNGFNMWIGRRRTWPTLEEAILAFEQRASAGNSFFWSPTKKFLTTER